MNVGFRGRVFFVAVSIIVVVSVTSAIYLEQELRTWLEERIEEEDTPSKAEDRARRKAAAQLSDEERARRITEAEARRKAEAKKQKSAAQHAAVAGARRAT